MDYGRNQRGGRDRCALRGQQGYPLPESQVAANSWEIEEPGSILFLGLDVVGGFLHACYIHNFEMSKNKNHAFPCPHKPSPLGCEGGGIWKTVMLTGRMLNLAP